MDWQPSKYTCFEYNASSAVKLLFFIDITYQIKVWVYPCFLILKSILSFLVAAETLNANQSILTFNYKTGKTGPKKHFPKTCIGCFPSSMFFKVIITNPHIKQNKDM